MEGRSHVKARAPPQSHPPPWQGARRRASNKLAPGTQRSSSCAGCPTCSPSDDRVCPQSRAGRQGNGASGPARRRAALQRWALQEVRDRQRTAHEQELRLPTHAVKCIAEAILPRPANVKPGRDEGAAFALLVDNTVRTWGKVDGCRCVLSNHSCKETREDDDAHFHVCFPYIAQPSRAVRSRRSCSSTTETSEAVAQTHHRLLSRCCSTGEPFPSKSL